MDKTLGDSTLPSYCSLFCPSWFGLAPRKSGSSDSVIKMDGDSRVTDLKVHHLKAGGEIWVSILSTDVWRDPRHLFWVQAQQLKGSHYANMTSEFQHLIEIMQLALSWCNYLRWHFMQDISDCSMFCCSILLYSMSQDPVICIHDGLVLQGICLAGHPDGSASASRCSPGTSHGAVPGFNLLEPGEWVWPSSSRVCSGELRICSLQGRGG